MFRYVFAVNRVSDEGKHEHQDGKTVSIDAPNEDVARSLAREELRKMSPGVQRFHPAELVSPPYELKPAKASPSAADLDADAKEKETEAATAGYTCAKHPKVGSSGPGVCPQCGKPLVPRSELVAK